MSCTDPDVLFSTSAWHGEGEKKDPRKATHKRRQTKPRWESHCTGAAALARDNVTQLRQGWLEWVREEAVPRQGA